MSDEGTMCCPICGQDSMHSHTADGVSKLNARRLERQNSILRNIPEYFMRCTVCKQIHWVSGPEQDALKYICMTCRHS